MAKPEVVQAKPEVREVIEHPGHGFFFAGVRGKNASLRAVLGLLEKKFGNGKATVYNSAFLAERPAADRYLQMAAKIKEKLQEGNVTIIAHSYGVVEAIRALTEDESLLNNSDFAKRIKLILISPVIPESWTDIAKKLTTFGKLTIQEARAIGVVFPGKSSIVNGIASANSLTSDVLSMDELDRAAALASPKLADSSQRGSGSFGQYEKRNYLAQYDSKTQDIVKERDTRIKKEMKKGKRWATRRALRRRGRMRKEVAPIYDGKYADIFHDPQVTVLPTGNRSEARSIQKRLIFDAAKGREKARFNLIKEKGVEVWRIDPKYDLMYAGRKARRRPQVPDDHVIVVPATTHAFPWAGQPEILAAIIDACNAIQ